MKTKACISMGIKDFDNFPNNSLPGTLKDVIHLVDFFKTAKKYTCDKVVEVPNDCTDEKNYKEMLLEFKGGKTWPENLRATICFSTHGSHIVSENEKDGYDEITVCKDFNGITGGILDEWWYEYLQGQPLSTRIWLLGDTCMSMGIMRSILAKSRYLPNPYCLNNKSRKKGLFSAVFGDSFIDASDDYPATLIPGCEENGTSSDTPDGGALTCSFLKVLKSRDFVTNRELIKGIRKELLKGYFSQKPKLQCPHHCIDELYMQF